MEIDSSAIRSLFIDSSLSEFFDETDLFYIDFQSSIARSCSTLRYLGYEDADLLDILGAFPVHEADRERVELMQKRIESGETDKVIDSFRVASKKDSRFPWLRFSIKVLGREPDGKPTALIGHVTDVDDLIASQEEIRERLVEIDAMRELIGAINKSLDFEETFKRIIEQLHRIIPFDRATVQAFENDSLTVIAGYGYPKSDIMGLVFPAKGIDNPAVRAIQTQRPIVCNDVSHDFPGFIAASKDFTSLSWLGIPMVYEGQAIGLIALDSHLPNFYTDQHVRVATAMAEHIATAFEHARSLCFHRGLRSFPRLTRSSLFLPLFSLARNAVPHRAHAHCFFCKRERLAGFFAHAHGTFVEDFLNKAFLGFVVGAALADRVKERIERAGELFFYFDIAYLACAVAHFEVFDFGFVRVEGVMVDEHRVAFDGAGNVCPDALGVGVHGHHALDDGLFVVGEKNRVVEALGHFGVAVDTDKRAEFRDHGFRNGEGLAVKIIEAAGDFPRYFDMGFVVLAYGHEVCARKKDIGRLQNRVAQQPEGHFLDVRVLRHFLEAGHAREPRHGDQVLEKERELCHFRHGGLQVDD